MADWYEDESFWETFYPFLFPEERFEAAVEQVEKILQLVHFQGQSVLDLACGPGRHAIELAKRGLRVTGVDRSPFLLEKAKTRASEAGVEVEWVQKDMRDFSRPESFDLLINMFSSFGYFEDQDDDLRVLQNVHRSLRPGGSCLLDVQGKERLARVFQPTGSHEVADGSILIERREIVDEWSRIRNDWILLKGDTARTFRFRLTIYSGQELKDRLSQAGFQKVRLYGDLDGTEYGLDAQRLIAVAWK